jgi:hypothetical protein
MQNSGRPQHIIAASPPAVADSITTFSSSHVGPGSVQLRPTCGITSVRVAQCPNPTLTLTLNTYDSRGRTYRVHDKLASSTQMNRR